MSEGKKVKRVNGRINHLPSETIGEVLKRFNYNLTAAANHLKVTRETITFRINKCEVLQKIVQSGKDEILDVAESELQKLVDAGDFKAIKFTLETIGKQRGYGKSVELTGNSQKPIGIINGTLNYQAAEKLYRATINANESIN